MPKKSSQLVLAAMVALASLLLSSAAARPYEEGREEENRSLGRLEAEHGEEFLGAKEQRANAVLAPTGRAPADANLDAIAQRNALAAKGFSDPANGHRWTPYGIGPLQFGDPGYTGVNTLGYRTLSGRITDLNYVPRNDRYMPNTVLASVAFGGIWRSVDEGESWRSLGDSLPTQTVGSVGYTPANRGTIIALTGDNSFGRYEREGAGAYYTTNLGKIWRYAPGIPSDTFGYKVAVDHSRPNIVYAATGAGLYRSTNGGRSWRNVAIPTGSCAGKSPRVKGCLLANQVTDVVVKEPGGSTNERGGQVLAAVGWMMGATENPDGTVQSPNNGLYFSDTGAPGSFTKLSAPGFALQTAIGRTELGAAIGPTQNHNIVYASVQDAVLRHQSFEATRTNNEALGPFTTWNGLYVTLDFGQTWQQLTNGVEIQHPLTGSQLAVVVQAPVVGGGFGPGIQSWFDEWVAPDPTREVGGIPTRVLFGLEEIWANELTMVPQAGKSAFHVIGRYYGGATCLFTSLLPACPVNREDALSQTTTTHADQHAAVFIPQRGGGVKVVVGNDGGVFTQKVASGGEIKASGWGVGAQRGFRTLEPYDAVISRDGTVWMGMQDNGIAKIQDVKDKRGRVVQRQRIIGNKGGDGFFMAVDPNNSDVAYSEYVYGALSATRDGGRTWADMAPPVTRAQFSNPFVLDPLDVDHLILAGNEVLETGSGPGTSTPDWVTVFDLGTAQHPGDVDAGETDTDAINQMTALDLIGANAYVGFCSACDVLNEPRPFLNGLATNVGGRQSPLALTSRGWHIVRPRGLPNRYITSIAIDPDDPKIVYVALGGYSRRWTPPGTLDRPDPNRVGTGHLYRSTDAGRHFLDISGNLPNTPVNWVTLRGDQLLVATDIGAFVSRPGVACGHPASSSCQSFEVLGTGLPASPVMTIRVAPHDRNLLTAATYGRGVWLYRFGPPAGSNIRAKRIKPAPFAGKRVAGPFGFEGNPEGWTASTTTSAGSPAAPARQAAEQWRLLPPGNNSAASFQVSPYADETTAALASPPMRIPGPRHATVRISWAMRLNTEECCDFVTIDYSRDGRFWQKGPGFAGLNDDYPLFSPYKAEIVVPPGKLFLRFRLTSDQLVSFPANEGVAIDDILIQR
jgi:hypothetical protein